MKKKNLIGCLSVGAAALMCGSFALGVVGLSGALKKDSYTVYADDDYYSETTYYLTEAAFNTYEEKKLEQVTDPKSKTILANKKLANTEQIDKEFVIGAVKRVWVSESIDENGFTNSRLLTKDEIKHLDYDVCAVENVSLDVTSTDIGNAEESMYYLDIAMEVDFIDDEYVINCEASWLNKFSMIWETHKSAEEFHMDYIGVTWGGDDTLVDVEHAINGKYCDNTLVTFSQNLVNSYSCILWQFNEKNHYLGDEMKYANATVKLNKEGEMQGKKTSIKMTYIHTYGAANFSLSIGVNGNKLAPSVNISSAQNNWKIEMEVIGVDF